MRKPAWTLRTGDRINIDGRERTVTCPPYALMGTRLGILLESTSGGLHDMVSRERLTAIEVV